ncbi:hypothetical protein Cni_G24063 [Canna indica]|uniref:DUF1677 family protein n=1 Tax=Canna indica TaxID=4628 RepID=A0AAQ3KU99_9LILI|nr:hypothetical protein Cni_G24063 [Canna indica]
MEIESAKCACCGLCEDCTEEYISSVKANFQGKWLCGLCSEAVVDELGRPGRRKTSLRGVEEAVMAHTAFCSKSSSNPAIKVADGMRQMLRRRSAGDLSAPPAANKKYYGRVARSS